jgi:hypothetical protein
VNYLAQVAYAEPRWNDGVLTPFGFFPGIGFIFDLQSPKQISSVVLYTTQLNTYVFQHAASASGPFTVFSTQTLSYTMVTGTTGPLYRVLITLNPVVDQVIRFDVTSGTGQPAEIQIQGCPALAGSSGPSGARLGAETKAAALSMPSGKDLLLGPNPVRGPATAYFRLAQAGRARLVLSDIAGEAVLRTEAQSYAAGVQAAALDLSKLSSGLYFLQLLTDEGEGWHLKATFKAAVVH